MVFPVCQLKVGRDKSIRRRHPWIFSGAIAMEPDAQAGDLVDVQSSDGEFLGRGAYNPNSQIRVRLFTFDDEDIDTDFFIRRISDARDMRRSLLPPETDCYRMVFSGGDRIPGLILDSYGRHLVLQFQTAAVDAQREAIIQAVEELIQPESLYERSDSGFRLDEGLEKRSGLISGEDPPVPLEITEAGIKYLIDIPDGQKSGFYLDQRASRMLTRSIAKDKSVLNVFSYSGGFAVSALAGGALRARNVDSSRPALDLAMKIYEANGFPVDEEDFVKHDAFDFLRNDPDSYDLVILDPPAFSKSMAGLHRAQKGYKEIILRGLGRLNPGGMLMAFSCSGHLNAAMFQKLAFAAAFDARKEVQILQRFGHGFDHPINIYHPEGEYLCGLLLQLHR